MFTASSIIKDDGLAKIIDTIILIILGSMVVSKLLYKITAFLLIVFGPDVGECAADEIDIYKTFRQTTVTKEASGKESSSQQIKKTANLGKSPSISFIIPAYNEEERLPIMLDETLNFFRKSRDEISKLVQQITDLQTNTEPPSENNDENQFTFFELVIVNDGSSDKTANIVHKYANKTSNEFKDTIRLIQMRENSGKGAAIREGMLRSTSPLCLMVDADGATDIHDLIKLLNAMISLLKMDQKAEGPKDTTFPIPAVIIGSRAHLEQSSKAERTKVRTFLMHAFHFFVYHLCSKNVQDTQCGFKLFHRAAATKLFSNLHLKRWAFDIEIITIAERLKMPITEVGVNWKEVDGSKLATSKWALVTNSVGMLRDMVFVRSCYLLGVWRIKE